MKSISRIFLWLFIAGLPLVYTITSISSQDNSSAGLDSFTSIMTEDTVESFTLDNGMRFLLVNRPEVPVFSAVVLVKAGSVDEPRGKTGVAHVFEHMAFKGTTTIGTTDYTSEKIVLDRIESIGEALTKALSSGAPQAEIDRLRNELKTAQKSHEVFIVANEFSKIFDSNGAKFINAGTGRDVTMYLSNMPKNRLGLWARMEADRLANPVFREFYKERDVIMEERRMGVDNDPSGHLWEEFAGIAYQTHPYGDPVIGYMDDIQNLTIMDARQFHQIFYVPSNIAVAVVGDISIEELRNAAEATFGKIPLRPDPEVRIPAEPVQNAERTVIVHKGTVPELILGWHSPNYPSVDACRLDIAARILAEGRSSRLYKRLVLEEGLATDVTAYFTTFTRYPELFYIRIQPKKFDDWQQIKSITMNEIQALVTDGPGDYELKKTKKSVIAEFVRSLESNLYLAIQLAYFEKVNGDWRVITKYLEQMDRITAADVSETVGKYLHPGIETTGLLKPVDKLNNGNSPYKESLHEDLKKSEVSMGGASQ
ncbi:insulinase family protein [bacterium]|nr:insulinase family protein [candidate division CSSED10-310 bacterium]